MNGPVVGATVCFYWVVNGAMGAQISVTAAAGDSGHADGAGCYVTGLDGTYDVVTPSGTTGEVLVVATGGTYCSDESQESSDGRCGTGQLIDATGDALQTFVQISGDAAPPSAPATPLTTAAVDQALDETGGLTPADFATAFGDLVQRTLGASGAGITPATLPSDGHDATAGQSAYSALLGQLAGAVVSGASPSTQLTELASGNWFGSVVGLPTIDALAMAPLVLENTSATPAKTLEIDHAGDITIGTSATMTPSDLSSAQIPHLAIAMQPSGATCALNDSSGTPSVPDIQIECVPFVPNGLPTAALLSGPPTTLSVGNSSCPNGGTATEWGVDANANGTLDVGEVDPALTTYSCTPETQTLGGVVYWEGRGPDETVTLADGNDDSATAEYNAQTTVSTFSFAHPLTVGQAYDLTVSKQPADWECQPMSGAPDTGTMGRADLTTLAIECIWQTAVSTSWSELNPDHVVRDAAGDLYSLSTGGDTVDKVAATDDSVSVFVSGLHGAAGIAINGAGDVYVADAGTGTGTGEVREFDASGTQIDVPVSGLASPTALAVDGSGDLFVSVSTGALYKVSVSGPVATILPAGSGDVFTAMAVDGSGTLFGAEATVEHDPTNTVDPVYQPILQISTASQAVALTSVGSASAVQVRQRFTAPVDVPFKGFAGTSADVTIKESFIPTGVIVIGSSIYGPSNPNPVPAGTLVPAAYAVNIPANIGLHIPAGSTVPVGVITDAITTEVPLASTTDTLTLNGTIPAGTAIPVGTQLVASDSVTIPAGVVLDENDGFSEVYDLALDSGCVFAGSTTCALYVSGRVGVTEVPTTGEQLVHTYTDRFPASGSVEGDLNAGVAEPRGLAVVGHDDVLVATTSDNFYEVTPTSTTKRTVSPTRAPVAVAAAPGGIVYFADRAAIRMQDADGTVSAFADGFTDVVALATDAAGDLFVADAQEQAVYEYTPAGVETTPVINVAGIQAISVDATGDLYIATSAGVLELSAGAGTPTMIGSGHYTTDSFGGVAVDGNGDVFVSDDTTEQIDEFTSATGFTVLAGDGANGFLDGRADVAEFDAPGGLAVDAFGDIYVADRANNAIRKISAPSASVSGLLVATLAGPPSCLTQTTTTCSGSAGTNITGVYGGEAGYQDAEADLSLFDVPTALALDANDTVYVADTDNGDVRAVRQPASTVEMAGWDLGDSLSAFSSAASLINFIHHSIWPADTTDTYPGDAAIVDFAWNLCLDNGNCSTPNQAMNLLLDRVLQDHTYFDILAAWPSISASPGWQATTTTRQYCTTDYFSSALVHAAPLANTCADRYSVTIPEDVAQTAWDSVALPTNILATAELLKGLLAVLRPASGGNPADPGYGTTLVQALSDLGAGCETAPSTQGSPSVVRNPNGTVTVTGYSWSGAGSDTVHPISCGVESYVLLLQAEEDLSLEQSGATLSPTAQAFEQGVLRQMLGQEQGARNQVEHDYNQLKADTQVTAAGGSGSQLSLGSLFQIDPAPTGDLQQGLQALMLPSAGSSAVDSTSVVLERLFAAIDYSRNATDQRVAFEDGLIPGGSGTYDPNDLDVGLGLSVPLASAVAAVAAWTAFFNISGVLVYPADGAAGAATIVPRGTIMNRLGIEKPYAPRVNVGQQYQQAIDNPTPTESADAASTWQDGTYGDWQLTNTLDAPPSPEADLPAIDAIGEATSSGDTAGAATAAGEAGTEVGNATTDAVTTAATEAAATVADEAAATITAAIGPIGVIVGALALIGSAAAQQAEADNFTNALANDQQWIDSMLSNMPTLEHFEVTLDLANTPAGNALQMQVAIASMVAQ
ncbi:MAG TPA: hypothetical protein VNF07_10775 [Acidimicrobiales bacterium]|nr:hypothetical protein [Acidimicrobiales bacterium]